MEKYGDRKKKLVLDLSPFFLFEAAGDSEGDLDQYHHNMMMMGMGSSSSSSCHDNEEDDAQSCSYDVWDDAYASNASSHHIIEARNDVCRSSSSKAHRISTLVHHHGHVDDDDDDDDDDGKLMMKGSKEGIMYSKIRRSSSREDCDSKCTSEVMSTANSNTSRKSCINSIEGQNMSEKERSRLFWEACLAS